MKTYFILLLITVSAFSAIAQDQKMPKAAEQLAEKLSDWELEAQATFKIQILEKRKQVVTALQQHLASATKQGDLDGALAIRNYIESISEGTITQSSSVSAPLNSDHAPFGKHGEIWKGKSPFDESVEYSLEVKSDEEVEFREGEKSQIVKYSVKGNLIKLWIPGDKSETDPWLLELSDSQTEGTFKFNGRGRETTLTQIRSGH